MTKPPPDVVAELTLQRIESWDPELSGAVPLELTVRANRDDGIVTFSAYLNGPNDYEAGFHLSTAEARELHRWLTYALSMAAS